MTYEQFIEWLDKEIELLKQADNYTQSEFERGMTRALKGLRDKFLSITPPATT